MRTQLITIVKNTFGLKASDLLNTIEPSKVQSVKGLPALLNVLSNDKSTRHDIAEALEVVVLNIKLHKTQSAYGPKFLEQLETREAHHEDSVEFAADENSELDNDFITPKRLSF